MMLVCPCHQIHLRCGPYFRLVVNRPVVPSEKPLDISTVRACAFFFVPLWLWMRAHVSDRLRPGCCKWSALMLKASITPMDVAFFSVHLDNINADSVSRGDEEEEGEKDETQAWKAYRATADPFLEIFLTFRFLDYCRSTSGKTAKAEGRRWCIDLPWHAVTCMCLRKLPESLVSTRSEIYLATALQNRRVRLDSYLRFHATVNTTTAFCAIEARERHPVPAQSAPAPAPAPAGVRRRTILLGRFSFTSCSTHPCFYLERRIL